MDFYPYPKTISLDKYYNDNDFLAEDPKGWVKCLRRDSSEFGETETEGCELSPINAFLELANSDLKMIAGLCSKPGAFNWDTEHKPDLNDEWYHMFAKALAADMRHISYTEHGPKKEGTHCSSSDRWFAALLEQIPEYLRPVPQNARQYNGEYLYIDTVKYLTDYIDKPDMPWQEGYALYFHELGTEPDKIGDKIDVPLICDDESRLCVSDYLWAKHNRPTYRIWPEWVESFTESKMDNIISSLWKMPFPAITLLMPKCDPPALYYPYVTFGPQENLEHLPVHTIRLTKLDKESFKRTPLKGLFNDEDAAIHLAITGERSCGQPLVALEPVIPPFQCGFHPNKNTITQHLQPNVRGMAYSSAAANHLINGYRQIWNVALSVAYLATNHFTLVEPDVLNRDITKYLKALQNDDTQKIKKLQATAIKNKRFVGFTINDSSPSTQILGKKANSGGTTTIDNPDPDRQLIHSHFRKGHFRTITDIKTGEPRYAKWIRPTIVRGDLGPKPGTKKYRSLGIG